MRSDHEALARKENDLSQLPVGRGPQPIALAQPYVFSSLDEETDGFEIFSRLRRHKVVFCCAFLLTLGFMGVIYAIAPRTYQGHASMIIANPEPLLGGTDPVVEQKRGDQADIESQSLVLNSLNLLQTVASEPTIGVLIKQECEAKRAEPLSRVREIFTPVDCDEYEANKVAAAEYLQGYLGVGEDGRSRVIAISYASPLARAAQLIPNAVVEAYIAEGLQERLNSRSAAINWLRSEIARVSGDLAKTEAQIVAFHRQHDLVRGETSSLAAERLTLVDQELASARAARSEAAAQLGEMQRGATDAPATLQNHAVNDIKHELSTVAGQIASVESSHGPAYPQLYALRQQQAVLNARLNREMARVAASLQQTYNAASAKAGALDHQLKDAKSQVAAATEAQTEIASLQRHADVEHELFVDLSKKVDALEIDRRVLSGDARVLSYAQYPYSLASPRKLPFALGGLMLALVVSVAATLMLDRGDRTVRTKRNLERVVGVPVLGQIPALRPTKLTSCRTVMTPSALQEATRQLFANCVLMHRTKPRSILISSALPADGKTFITLALAQFAARSGRRVLAIEGDLRRPDFERALSLKANRGFADYLHGNAKFEELLLAGGVPGLDVIVAGTSTFDSTELISNGRVGDLLSWAVDRYELVLVDGPPTRALVDSNLLAKEVDGVLFCVRWGASDTRIVTEAIHDLTATGAHFLGVAINFVVARQLPLYDKYGGRGLQYSHLG